MTKWEYRSANAPHYEDYDRLGIEGWELVGFDANGRAHFKRPITSTDEAGADQPGQFPHKQPS